MATDPNKEIQFEIGHVLFIDIVGYSKLLINEQSDQIQKLKEIVRGTEQFRLAETEGKLLRLPTGDGGALVFRSTPEAPVLCALEISKALKSQPELRVRMGIHSGPVNEITDLNEQANIAGAGINLAQRVMDCGDAGHILISKRVADDLEQYPRWRSHLRDLGECEVKHGVRIHAFNFYTEEVGNPGLPEKFKRAAIEAGAKKAPAGRKHLLTAALAAVVILAAGAGYYFMSHRSAPVAEKIAEKSIAVLPMVNSTGDAANEYFSDGMSEEFISSLSRLSDLKVIGRTSSFQFKGTKEDSKTIGEKLGVRYLLEGSVRKSAERVRITISLINANDGANVWSETYDRELKDIFAVQSEIAGAVAKHLQVAFLGNNGQTAQLPPTATPSHQNVEAYNALLQGNFYSERRTAEDYEKAIGYYEEAIRLDPGYALAYARLSLAAEHRADYYGTKDKQETIVKARAAAGRALRLDPNLAGAHLAQGRILMNIDFDFTGAEAEFRRALELAPQDSEVTGSLGTLMAFLGRLDKAVALTQRATVLDPLRTGAHYNLGNFFTALGRYDEGEAELRKAIALQPQSAQNYVQLARIEIHRGRPEAALELAKQETDPFWRTYGLALACFAHGDRAEADAHLKKLIDENADNSGYQIAQVYAFRREPEKMFEWLEHAWTTHDGGVAEILLDSFLRTYKADPRFIAFAQKVGVIPKTAATTSAPTPRSSPN